MYFFKDREDAGKRLVSSLKHYRRENIFILALPRGGVPVGFEIAQALNAPLDVLVIRKLGVPDSQEFAFGAIGPNNIIILNNIVIQKLNITQEQVQDVIEEERQELSRQLKLFRDDRHFPDIGNKTVILVDDGLATGSTALAAVNTLKEMKPSHLILAVPVASSEAARMLSKHVDILICLFCPSDFGAVAEWYQDFRQVSDIEVSQLLEKSKKEISFSGI